MEEHVGQWWHRFVTKLADTGFPQATVTLEEMEKRIAEEERMEKYLRDREHQEYLRLQKKFEENS